MTMKPSIILITILMLDGCGKVATTFTDRKLPVLTQSGFAKEANSYFWENFHAGNYDSIPKIIQKLSRAMNENPNDLITTAHLGFSHIWALSERQRLKDPNPLIAENL